MPPTVSIFSAVTLALSLIFHTSLTSILYISTSLTPFLKYTKRHPIAGAWLKHVRLSLVWHSISVYLIPCWAIFFSSMLVHHINPFHYLSLSDTSCLNPLQHLSFLCFIHSFVPHFIAIAFTIILSSILSNEHSFSFQLSSCLSNFYSRVKMHS